MMAVTATLTQTTDATEIKMDWKQIIPTIPGIYLVKRPSSAEIKTFEVYFDDKEKLLAMSLVNSLGGAFLRDRAEDETWWCGPIPLPPGSQTKG